MMKTPICDFVRGYAKSGALRMHMPGHKGVGAIGVEALDVTEIGGADSLFEANGIIAESERNAGELFGAESFYSTEGSSLSIRAMVYLVAQKARERGEKPLIFAGRNAHRAFLTALALTDTDVAWLTPDTSSYLSCPITAQEVGEALERASQKPIAVYLTSPDYLGNTVDIASIAAACHKHGVFLLVDNAHGAYLKFLPESRHPVDLGADLCCDSAHKTLPVLTGGGYLHVSHTVVALFAPLVKQAMALFASTSPSYLILQSLDAVNPCLAREFPTQLAKTVDALEKCKGRLAAHGYTLCGDEPLKLTLAPKPYGYRGTELADLLAKKGIVCEFADPDFVVLMPSPTQSEQDIAHLERVLCSIGRKSAIEEQPPVFFTPSRALSVREAIFAPVEELPVAACAGRVLAQTGVACPPAVPILVSGERIDEAAMRAFAYYGTERCLVVREK